MANAGLVGGDSWAEQGCGSSARGAAITTTAATSTTATAGKVRLWFTWRPGNIRIDSTCEHSKPTCQANPKRPLALIPVPLEVTEPPKPLSNLKFFPNYVSYPKSAHIPKPPRFVPSDPNAYDCIVGEPLDVLVAVRMPRPPTVKRPVAPGEEDDDAVMDEWGGVEIGVASWTVTKDAL